jgi:hypothetical protein
MNFLEIESRHKQVKKMFYVTLSAFVCISLLTDPVFAVTVAKLQDPIKDLKQELFGGWMNVVKVCSVVVGIVYSAVRFSLLPAGIGAGISASILFFDKWLGTGADGALIY